ncbi:MAG TPA: hypothetical protein VEK81_02765 [Burkholderiales bacterium]|nr:hypothetical protein [Burkholderiales bacterium]
MPAIDLTSSTYRGFAALTGSFWHSRTASANSVTLLAFGRTYEVMLRVRIAAPDASGAAADRRGFIRVKFKLFSFLENTRRTGDKHALQSR